VIFERGLDEESLGFARKVVEAEDSKLGGSLDRKALLVVRYEEGRSSGARRRLHLQEPRLAVGGEREDIVAGSITIFLSHPSHVAREVVSSRSAEASVFRVKDAFLSPPSERAISRVASRGVELSNQTIEGRCGFPRARVDRRRRADEDGRLFGEASR
jgi:hypothetical protein